MNVYVCMYVHIILRSEMRFVDLVKVRRYVCMYILYDEKKRKEKAKYQEENGGHKQIEKIN